MRTVRLWAVLCAAAVLLCSCKRNEYNGAVPDLRFEKVTHNAEGVPCSYIFDDNPEHLTPEFLADAEAPSSIAHFEDLKSGVYTIFSYHHRGTAAEAEKDLFFDVLFTAESDAKFKITKIGLDHDWQWNKAWADFSGTDVYKPEYLKSFDCTCGHCFDKKDGGKCAADCGCCKRGEIEPTGGDRFDGSGKVILVNGGANILLSEAIPNIGKERINEIRHGSYNEPIWLMAEIEILSGKVTVDTVAYSDKAAAKKNFAVMKKGRFVYEPQFKGIADCAPIVKAELSYTFDNETTPCNLPIRIFNQKYKNGYVASDGSFATNVNTWKDSRAISAESAESDMIELVYKDERKLTLYGENAEDKNDIWRFSPFYTSLYEDSENPDFQPNIPIENVDYPKGGEKTSRDFYAKYVCNLGNFGVRYIYTIHLRNNSDSEKVFTFSMNSVSGQLYRYSLSSGGEVIKDDGGRYIMKCFDTDPREKRNGEREKPSKYTTSEEFLLDANTEYTLTFETVTLTGCDAPMTNRFAVR